MKVLVKCDNCKEDYNIPLAYYHRKQRANISLNELGKPATFCSKICVGQYKKYINRTKKAVPLAKETTTESELTAEEDLDLWFGKKVSIVSTNNLASGHKIIGGFLTNPDNFNDGVSDNLLSKENVMSEASDLIAQILAKHPEWGTMTFVEAIKSEQMEQPVAATPIPQVSVAPVLVQPVAVQTMTMAPAPGSLIQPAQAPVQPVSKWQDSLDNKGEVCKCDADFWDAGKTMKKCNFNIALNRFKYSVVDSESGQLIFTPQSRDCYRCQGKGFLTEANLGYNWESDIKRGVIPATVTWEQYKMEHIG
tara:strand:- start:321 stop:1241 length:921 start_codon:yes stop_codon:yes gene_type:complete